jgi:hypothetical protein
MNLRVSRFSEQLKEPRNSSPHVGPVLFLNPPAVRHPQLLHNPAKGSLVQHKKLVGNTPSTGVGPGGSSVPALELDEVGDLLMTPGSIGGLGQWLQSPCSSRGGSFTQRVSASGMSPGAAARRRPASALGNGARGGGFLGVSPGASRSLAWGEAGANARRERPRCVLAYLATLPPMYRLLNFPGFF